MNELLEKSKLGDVEAFSELIKLVSKDLKKIVIRRILDQSYVDDVLQLSSSGGECNKSSAITCHLSRLY